MAYPTPSVPSLPEGCNDPTPLPIVLQNEQQAADPATVLPMPEVVIVLPDITDTAATELVDGNVDLGEAAEPGEPAEAGEPADAAATLEMEEDAGASPAGAEVFDPTAALIALLDGRDEHEEGDPSAASSTTPKLDDSHKKQDTHKASVNCNTNADGLSVPFQTALTRKFDRVPMIWGKDVLSVTPSNFQTRLGERQAHCEAMRVSDHLHSKEPSAALADSDNLVKPERENKYRPDTTMYRKKPAVSEEQLSELIWGSYEQRTIDLFFAWEQARQSSELSHILERITNIEGVTAFIIFDIYKNEIYPPESNESDNLFEEDENGFPVKREQNLQLVDGKWEIPPHIIYTSTDLRTAKKIIPFTKQLIWRLVETTRDLDPKNDVRYLRLISDINEIVVMPMFPRHFLIAVQEPKSSPNVLFENLGLVTTHPAVVEKGKPKRRVSRKRTLPKGSGQIT